jgi:hypothetical protein
MRQAQRMLLRAALLRLIPAKAAKTEVVSQAILDRRAGDRPPALLVFRRNADQNVAEHRARGEVQIEAGRGALVAGDVEAEQLDERLAIERFDRAAECLAQPRRKIGDCAVAVRFPEPSVPGLLEVDENVEGALLQQLPLPAHRYRVLVDPRLAHHQQPAADEAEREDQPHVGPPAREHQRQPHGADAGQHRRRALCEQQRCRRPRQRRHAHRADPQRISLLARPDRGGKAIEQHRQANGPQHDERTLEDVARTVALDRHEQRGQRAQENRRDRRQKHARTRQAACAGERGQADHRHRRRHERPVSRDVEHAVRQVGLRPGLVRRRQRGVTGRALMAHIATPDLAVFRFAPGLHGAVMPLPHLRKG